MKKDNIKTDFGRKLNYHMTLRPFKGSWRLIHLISRILISRPHGDTKVHLPLKLCFIIDPEKNRGLEDALYYRGIYEAGTLMILKHCLRPKDIFFDVGSNIGLMSLFSSKIIGEYGRVYAFEPIPDIFSRLENHIKINKRDNIIACNIALGAKSEVKSIFMENGKNQGEATLIEPAGKIYSEIKAQVKSIDEFCDNHNINKISMIKIDVEGWELEVLKGGKKILSGEDAPMLCIECSKKKANVNDLHTTYNYVLAINNYCVYKLVHGKDCVSKLVEITKASQLPDHDNLFCFLPQHKERIKNIIKK